MESRHFTLVVVGDNHEELVKKYDKKLKVEPYVLFKFDNADVMRKNQIKLLKAATKLDSFDGYSLQNIKDRIDELEHMSAIEYYAEITDDDTIHHIDEETGDAYSDANPNGKYDGCNLGKNFSLPLKTYDGEELYSCKVGDVDWSKMHNTDSHLYEFAWDSIMEKKVNPSTDEEKQVYENMKNFHKYFETYKTRDNYVKSNTSFWGYAFLSENTGWVELGENEDQFSWVNSFYDTFISHLDKNETISIYECTRYKE